MLASHRKRSSPFTSAYKSSPKTSKDSIAGKTCIEGPFDKESSFRVIGGAMVHILKCNTKWGHKGMCTLNCFTFKYYF